MHRGDELDSPPRTNQQLTPTLACPHVSGGEPPRADANRNTHQVTSPLEGPPRFIARRKLIMSIEALCTDTQPIRRSQPRPRNSVDPQLVGLGTVLSLLETMMGQPNADLTASAGSISLSLLSTAAELLILLMMKDRYMNRTGADYLVEYLRDRRIMLNVGSSADVFDYDGSCWVAYREFIDHHVAPHSAIYHTLGSERRGIIAWEDNLRGIGYALLATARLRQGIVGEDDNTLLARYRALLTTS